MDISKILIKYYLENSWYCGDTYESLEWNDESEKPSKEHLESLWNDVLKDEMRMERNKLLKESDYTVLPDFPTPNKQAWLDYREELRNFPAVRSVGASFPVKPIS
jgi:hypothetical protein